MKLDPRIKDRKYIFDCFNADEATKYMGKKCYMTDYFERFKDVESTAKCTLGKIDDGGFFCDGESDLKFTFCLPFEFVEPKEKKIRPYTLAEFCDKFRIGCPINFRPRGDDAIGYLMLLGYWRGQNKDREAAWIYIGRGGYTLEELFECYEWYEDETGDWRPFGVEVEE